MDTDFQTGRAVGRFGEPSKAFGADTDALQPKNCASALGDKSSLTPAPR
jgi:hypothetical protein